MRNSYITGTKNPLFEVAYIAGPAGQATVQDAADAGYKQWPLSVQQMATTDSLMRFTSLNKNDTAYDVVEHWHLTLPAGSLSFSEPTSEAGKPNLFLQKGGRVGIGTPHPEAQLHVKGDLQIGDKLTLSDSSGKATLQATGKGELILNRDGGNVGIGEDIQLGNNELLFTEGGQIRSADDHHRILFRRGENKLELREFGDLIFSPGAATGKETAKVVMLANGRVGIGTPAPDTQLHVQGDFQVGDKLTLSDKGGQATLQAAGKGDLILNPQGGKVIIGAANSDQLHVRGGLQIDGRVIVTELNGFVTDVLNVVAKMQFSMGIIQSETGSKTFWRCHLDGNSPTAGAEPGKERLYTIVFQPPFTVPPVGFACFTNGTSHGSKIQIMDQSPTRTVIRTYCPTGELAFSFLYIGEPKP